MITEEQAREAAAFLQFKIADAYLDQLDRDAKEAETPCPDLLVRDSVHLSVVVKDGALFLSSRYGWSLRFDCKTVADLRRWCAALQVEMPELKPCERPE